MALWPRWVLFALAFKLLLAYGLPMTGDEAYFVLWGRHLDVGYYDHPPMAGWMTALMGLVSEHRLWIRLPGVLSEFVVAGLFYQLLAPWNRQKAQLFAGVMLLSPLSLIFAFTLTDTGCLIFSGLAFWAAALAIQRDRLLWSAMAGVALGLAFLSKYFAAIVGLGFVLFYASYGRTYWRHGLMLVLAAIPFGLLNLYWNQTHCWSNVVFNVLSRQHEAQFGVTNTLMYLGFLLYWLLPPAVWWLLRERQRLRWSHWPDRLRPVAQLSAVIAMTAVLVFFFASLERSIGLHWLVWLPGFIWLLLWPLPLAYWQRLWRWSWLLGVLHAVLLTAIVYAPDGLWEKKPRLQWYRVAMMEAAAVLAKAEIRVDAPFSLAAADYPSASVLSYQVNQPVAVIGTGSKYARQDDFWTDWRQWQGRDVLVFMKRQDDLADAEHWFASVSRFSVQYRGQTFWFLHGRQFNYSAYRERVLSTVMANFYAQPSWLPAGECPMALQYALPERRL